MSRNSSCNLLGHSKSLNSDGRARTVRPRRQVASDSGYRLQSRGLVHAAFGTVLLILATSAYAGKPVEITDSEMALLPKYCADTQTFKYGGESSPNMSPNAPMWVERMGRGFWAMHHYCYALINLARAQKPSMPANIRQATRKYAIDDMDFVIASTNADFVMLPEIYTKIGEVQLLLKNVPEARNAFAKARSLKADYWPPYLRWAEYLHQAGQKDAAREVVEEGLSYSPDAKALRSLLVTLGGDPAKIRPRLPPATVSDPTNSSDPGK